MLFRKQTFAQAKYACKNTIQCHKDNKVQICTENLKTHFLLNCLSSYLELQNKYTPLHPTTALQSHNKASLCDLSSHIQPLQTRNYRQKNTQKYILKVESCSCSHRVLSHPDMPMLDQGQKYILLFQDRFKGAERKDDDLYHQKSPRNELQLF